MYNKGDSLRLDRRLVPTIYNIFVLYSAHQVKSFLRSAGEKVQTTVNGFTVGVSVY